MPDDDITHPIPDLTGYITEGQIVLNRSLNQKGVYPPIDVLPSLSRLMNAAIGEGHTREDHRSVADQIYAFYAEGRDLEKLVTIIGEGSLSEQDRRVLEFAKRFEKDMSDRAIPTAPSRKLGPLLGFALHHPAQYLKRIPEEYIRRYLKK